MTKAANDIVAQLKTDIARYANNPFGFTMYAYPWGEENTILSKETGPDKWQERILKDIGHGLQYGWIDNNGKRIDCSSGIFVAVRSGHGIGKSALMAMLDQWFSSTHPNPAVVTTANTKDQLTSKTWREMAKWHKMMINSHWFKWTATKFFCLSSPETWFSTALPWSENRPEAFAGTHEKYVMIKFDEASAIPDVIWETVEGAMTESDGIKIWIVFGNPTRNTGRFSECFKKFRNLWAVYEVDSRDSKRTDKALIERWIEAYGEDSDFVRVRVKGQEPRSGSTQFIGNELVNGALGKVLHPSQFHHAPRILGVDVARFGDDQSVMIKRQGLASFDLMKFREKDTMEFASLVAQEILKFKPHATLVDCVGLGAGVVDRLRQLKHDVIEVNGGHESPDEAYFNKRAYMWGAMKDWLKSGGALPNDSELRDDLTGPEYGFNAREKIQLEKKEDMKARGLSSPDCGDALAMTFAEPINLEEDSRLTARTGTAIADYDLFSDDYAPVEDAVSEYDLFGD